MQKSKEEQPVKEVRKKSKEEVKKSKQMIANPNYVVGGAETPFVPILDPKAHALTGRRILGAPIIGISS